MVNGGAGNDRFRAVQSGELKIQDFDANGNDRIELLSSLLSSGGVVDSFTADDADQDGSTDDLAATLSGGISIQLLDMAFEDLDDDDFIGIN